MKSVVISSVVAVGLIVLAAVLGGGSGEAGPIADGTNVYMEGGTQVVEIAARGGYTPRDSVAKAGLPTLIRFKTSGTFDCSSSVIIPALGISKYLPQSGSTDVDLGTQPAGLLQGSCGMGMYPFAINFQG
jgi:P-type Cu+ transporter